MPDDPVLSGQGEGAPVETTPAAIPAAAPTPQELKIKWSGKEIAIPGDKVSEYAQKGYDYTQKMQELAREREQVKAWSEEKAQYEQAIQEIREFLADQARVKAYYDELVGKSQTQPQGEPETLTKEQVQRMLEQQGQLTQQQLAQLRTQFEVDALAQQYKQEIDGLIGELKAKTPELAAIPRLERIVKEAVQEMGPQSIEEAKSFVNQVVQEYASQIKNAIMEGRKQAVTPNPALLNGIEPPGGSGVMPAAQPNFKSVSDPAFKQAVMQDMIAALKGGSS